MKKLVCAILVLTLTLCTFGALAQELNIPEVAWEHPVPLTDMVSEYTILVNNDNLLDKSIEPDPLIKVKGIKRATSAAVYLEETAANALTKMFEAAALVSEFEYVDAKGKTRTAEYGEDGMVLYLKSGYRSYGTQSTVYANYLARNNNVDDGYVAKPGSSEHQTGLCADVLNADYASRPTMTQDFKWTPEAQWMKANCADFGFILRYTEESEAQNGIKFEPWHFRYVGKTVASYIMGSGITLEDFAVEAEEVVQDFLDRGGDVEEQLAYEYFKLNAPPMSFVLDKLGEDGDAEVSMIF